MTKEMQIAVELLNRLETVRLSNQRDLAREIGVSKVYLQQITHKLSKAGVVTTVKGRNGGVRRASDKVSVAKVYQVFNPVESLEYESSKNFHDMVVNALSEVAI